MVRNTLIIVEGIPCMVTSEEGEDLTVKEYHFDEEKQLFEGAEEEFAIENDVYPVITPETLQAVFKGHKFGGLATALENAKKPAEKELTFEETLLGLSKKKFLALVKGLDLEEDEDLKAAEGKEGKVAYILGKFTEEDVKAVMEKAE